MNKLLLNNTEFSSASFLKTATKILVLFVLVFWSVPGMGQTARTFSSTTAITEAFTGFAGAAAPTNWGIQGTGSGGTAWRGTGQTTGSAGGWYGNNNISFLGSGSASNGNATWVLQNTTGAALTGFTISFKGILFKTGTATPTVTATYSTSATSTNPAAGAQTAYSPAISFTDAVTVSGQTFNSSVTLSIPNNNYVFVRFIFSGGSSSDNLGIDDVVFTPSPASTAPTINFAAFTTPQNYGASSFTVSSTSNSAGAITYSSNNTAVATVSGTTVTMVGAGVAVITATQAANGSYSSGTATQTLTVNTKQLTFSSFTFADKIYNGNNTATPTLGALSGIINSDDVSISPSPIASYTYNNASVGSNKTITVAGVYTLTGTKASSYTIVTPSTSLTGNITAKQLTVTGLSANSRQFEAANTAINISGTPSLSGVIVADGSNVSITGTAFGSVATDAVENNKPVTVTGLTLAGSAAGNYTLSLPTDLTASITAAAVPNIVVANNITALTTTYGTNSSVTSFTVAGTDISTGIGINPPVGYQVSTSSDFSANVGFNASPLILSGSGTVATTTVYLRFAMSASAGTYASGIISVSSPGATTRNLSIPTSTVNTKALTISGVTTSDRVYNATTIASLTTGTLVGLFELDAANVTLDQGSGAFADANIGTAKTVTVSGFSISGPKAANYSLTQPSALTANITAKNLTITSATATNRGYAAGNTTVTVGGTLVGVEGSDVITITGSVATDAVGTGKAVTFALAGTNAGNYTLTQPSPQVTVNITAQTLGFSLTSASYTQNFDGLGSPASATTFTDNSTIPGWYSHRTGTGTTFTTDNGNSTAGGLYSYGTTSATDRALGTTGSGNAAAGSFYHGFAFTNNTGNTINSLTITYTMEVWRLGVANTAQNITLDYKTYSTFPTLTGNWLNTLSGTTAVSTLTAGISGLTTTGIKDGNVAPNKITVTETITGLNLASGQYMVIRLSDLDHSGTDNAQAIDDFSISAPSPSIQTLKEGLATIANAGEVTFASGPQNVQATKTLTITNTGTSILNIASINRTSGDASFSVSGVPATVAGGGSANFTLTFDRTTEGTDRTALFTITSDNGDVANSTQTFTAKGTVTAPETTIAANGTLVALITTYGTASANTSFTINGTNILGGIQVNPPAGFQVSTTADFSANVGTNGNAITVGGNGAVAVTTVYVRIPTTTIPGTYSGNIVLTSTNATNVNVATVSSTVSVKPLNITGLSVTSKVYNKTNAATITGTPSLSGIINGNTVTVTGTAAGTFADVNVGTGKTVNITGITLSGTDAAYYSLSAPTLTTGIITAKALTVTGATATSKEYDASTTAAVNGTIVGVESGDVVTLTGSFASITVGTAKPVTFGLTGASAGNYTLTQPTPQVTANITAPAYPYVYKNDITGTDTYLQNPYTTGQYSDPNITVSGLTRGPGLTGAAGGDRFSANGFPTSATIDPALDYYEITITPNSGIKINLTQFKFSSQRSGNMSVALRSSLDNYTANLGSPTTGGSETNTSVSLGSSFFNLNTAITFRIYGFSAAAPGTTFSINSFEVIGTTYDENTASGLPNTSIFENDITGVTPGGTNPFATGQIVNSNITVEGIRRGSGLSNGGADDRFTASSWTQSATARVSNEYFEFKITPNAGYLVNFYSFVYNGERSNAGPNEFAVYSSVDNYTTAIATVGSGEGAAVTVNLNTATFKNITSVITFRVYAWGSASGGTYSINNFQFNGAVIKLGGIFRTTASGDFSNAATWQYSESDVSPVWYVSPIVPNADAISIQVQENHTLTINESATIQNVSVASGGTLTIGSGHSLTINNGTGTDFDIAGNVVNNGTITIANGAAANFATNSNYTHAANGGAVPAATWAPSSTVTFTGITNTAPTGLGQTFGNVVWNNPSQSADINLDLGLITVIASNLTIASTNASNLILSGSTASTLNINGNLTQSGGSLVLNNGSTGTDNINVGGNFNFNGGTITSGVGNVANLKIAGNLNIAASATVVPTAGLKFVMNGNAITSINNSNAATNLGLLEINKTSGGVVLNNSIAVNTIDFQSGSVDATQNGVDLTVNTSILNEGVGKKVIGNSTTASNITERGATEYTFGSAGLTLIFPANGGELPGTISVTRITNNSVTGATGAASVARRYNVTATNNQNLNCTMKFSVLSDELNGLTAANLNLSRSTNSGSSWITVARSGNVETASDLSTVTATGINAFSDWTLEGDNAPLPVTLVAFTGKVTQFGNELTWITASELNNQGFRIERSENGKDFTTIGFVSGKGTTNAKQNYSYSDTYGSAYYRLTQVDFDGKTTLTNVIFVGAKSNFTATVAPNPTADKARLHITGSTEHLVLQVMRADGKVLLQTEGTPIQVQATFETISQKLNAGTYFIKLVDGSNAQTIKLLKQ